MVCDSLERKWAVGKPHLEEGAAQVPEKAGKIKSERELVELLLERERVMFAQKGFDPALFECGPAVLYR